MSTTTIKEVQNHYDVLSPDGFSIDPLCDFYTSRAQAQEAFEKWKKRYEQQGYYSYRMERIPLEELEQYCTIEIIEPELVADLQKGVIQEYWHDSKTALADKLPSRHDRMIFVRDTIKKENANLVAFLSPKQLWLKIDEFTGPTEQLQ